MAETPLTPASDILYKTFSDSVSVDLLLTIPTLTAMLASIALGILMLRIDKKIVLIFGVACYCIGGICGGLVESLPYMIFMRAILGLGLGACNVAAIAIASDQSENEAERQKLTSYITAGISISAMFFTFFGGQLTSLFGWQSIFCLYWTGIPMLIMVVLFIPSSKEAKVSQSETQSQDTAVTDGKFQVIPFCCQTILEFFWFLTYGVVFFQIAVYISECNIGDAAFAGAMSSICNLIAFIASLCFPLFYKKSKMFGSCAHYLALCLGYVILWLFRTPATVVLACILLGYGFGHSLSFFPINMGELVPKSKSSIAATAYSATMGIGMFLSAFAVSLLKSLLDTDSMVALLPFIIAAAAVGFGCSIAVRLFQEKKHHI